MKKAIISYLMQIIEQAIDAYVSKTPTKLDDEVWKEIKTAIHDNLLAQL